MIVPGPDAHHAIEASGSGRMASDCPSRRIAGSLDPGEPAILSDTGVGPFSTGGIATLTIFVAGVCGREITDFLLDCTDDRYRQWWPGTHLELHALSHRRGHVGDIVLMDEYVGKHRVRMQAAVVRVVPAYFLQLTVVRWVMSRCPALPTYGRLPGRRTSLDGVCS